MDETLKTILLATIPSLVLGIPTIISAIYIWKYNRGKLPIESKATNGAYTKDISTSYRELMESNVLVIQGLKDRIEALEEITENQEKEIQQLKKNQEILYKQLKEAGIQPAI